MGFRFCIRAFRSFIAEKQEKTTRSDGENKYNMKEEGCAAHKQRPTATSSADVCDLVSLIEDREREREGERPQEAKAWMGTNVNFVFSLSKTQSEQTFLFNARYLSNLRSSTDLIHSFSVGDIYLLLVCVCDVYTAELTNRNVRFRLCGFQSLAYAFWCARCAYHEQINTWCMVYGLGCFFFVVVSSCLAWQLANLYKRNEPLRFQCQFCI